MNRIKSHFEIHSRFRNGIFLLSLFLFAAILVYYYYPQHKKSPKNLVELTKFQMQIDSLKKLAVHQKKQYQIRPFNPNFISEHKGYMLGISAEELDRLNKYRSQGKWINSAMDFKNVTQVSDSLLRVISPLFKFPEWTKHRKSSSKESKNKYPTKTYNQKMDLNSATASSFQGQVNVPVFIAERIITYRDKLGGFVSDIQLKDIKGLYASQRKQILASFTVKTPKKIKKININSASINQLIEVPYFDFETALDIRDFVKANGGISSFEELGKIKDFSLEKIDRIALYLTLK